MIPNIFISSTILDLHYLRDATRDAILELGYNPIMSEYGDFGLQPHLTIEDSCYNAMRESQLAIIIIGKRYGVKSLNGLSVTQNEFQTARKHSIPVICLIDKEVLSFKKIYESNGKPKNTPYPEMDNPSDTFEFINEFIESKVNNGYRPFETVNDVRINVKNQLAHIFGYLLREKYDPIKSGIQDIISEIKTLRHEILPNKPKENLIFLQTTRYLIDETNNALGFLLEQIHDRSIDDSVLSFIKHNTLADIINSKGFKFLVQNIDDIKQIEDSYSFSASMTSVSYMVPNEIIQRNSNKNLTWGIVDNEKIIIINSLTKEYLEYLFEYIKTETVK